MFLLLISGLIQIYYSQRIYFAWFQFWEYTLRDSSSLNCLLRFVLWPSAAFVNVLSPLENNMYSSLARWSILLISVRFSWLMAFVDLVGSIFLYLACLLIYLFRVCLFDYWERSIAGSSCRFGPLSFQFSDYYSVYSPEFLVTFSGVNGVYTYLHQIWSPTTKTDWN